MLYCYSYAPNKYIAGGIACCDEPTVWRSGLHPATMQAGLLDLKSHTPNHMPRVWLYRRTDSLVTHRMQHLHMCTITGNSRWTSRNEISEGVLQALKVEQHPH